MSLALVRAAPLKPEIRLAQAISEFEMKLSLEQKVELHSHSHIPDVDDIMRLTAEIDRTSAARANEQRRCYGPRVTSFLEGLHQFAVTVDIAVGGVQSSTVSGVWTVVRFSLLALTKYSPYIERLSKLLMVVSRATSFFKEIGKLYLRSKRIQDGLFEYYIVAVKLCQELYILSRKTAIGQLWSAFSDESYQKQFDRWSQTIQAEVQLETAKLVKEESKKSIAFRFRSQKHMEVQQRQQQRDLKQQVLDACSPYNYKTIWKQTRKLGNTTLFTKSNEYQDWIGAQSSCTLCYSGKLGSGKSVLMANIVDDLYLNDTVSTVTYFFCRYDTAESLEPRTIIGCLARQILQHLPNMDALEDKIKEISSSDQLDTDELLQLIKTNVTKRVHFVVDGLDDLNPDKRGKFLSDLYDLQQEISLLICISARSPQDVLHGTKYSENILHATIPETNADIEDYINSEIDYRLAAGTLMIFDNELVQEVKQKLIAKSQGMFLWVYLQIVNLCSLASDFEIRESLSDLPEGIAETYNRLLQDYDKSRRRLRLFQLILVAYEPLHTEELREALSVEPGIVVYDPTKLLHNVDSIVRSCKGLVMIDEEETTVRLVHFSIHQFLMSSTYKEQISEASAQNKMSEVILTYLNYSVFEHQITTRRPQKIRSSAIPAAIIIQTIPVASKFVRISQNSQLDRVLANAGKPVKTDNGFKTYALNYWDKHLMAAEASDCCLKMLDTAISTSRIDFQIEHDRLTPLQRAVMRQSLSITEVLLKHIDAEYDRLLAVPLATATENSEIVDMLIQGLPDYSLLFQHSIENDDHILMESLLRNCPDDILSAPDSPCNDHLVLLSTINSRNYAMVDLLLRSRKVDPRGIRNSRHKKPLYYAVELQDLEMLELLAEYMPVERFDQDELWTVATSNWDKRGNLQRAHVISFLLQREYLNLRCSLRGRQVSAEVFLPAGLAPLTYVAMFGMLEIMKVMLESDPRIAILVNQGSWSTNRGPPVGTPYDYASSEEAKSLLARYGGKSWYDLQKEQREGERRLNERLEDLMDLKIDDRKKSR